MGSSGSGSKGSGRVRGHARHAGLARGPRARAGWMAGAVGLAGPRSRAGLAAVRLLSSFSFSILFFFFFVLNSNLVLKFEFQFGAPYSLEFLDMRPTTFFYMCILGIYLAILYNKN